jgi:hypothetical protein
MNSLINAIPGTSTLTVGIYSQPSIARSSGLISPSTNYTLPAWAGTDYSAILQPSESIPGTSTLTVGIYSQQNIAGSSGLISASTTYVLPAGTGADRNTNLLSSESIPYTSTLAQGIYSQPNIPGTSGLISANTTYAPPAWAGADHSVILQSSESIPDTSTLTLGIYSQQNVAGSSGLISASQVSFRVDSPTISNVGGNVTVNYSSCDYARSQSPPDTSSLVMASYTQPNSSDFSFRSGTGYVSLTKSISDLTANGSVIVGWTLIYQTPGAI